MNASDELRNLAESWVVNGDIPSYVKHDLDTLAIDVSEIERERDERRLVTAQEHGRVVQVYIDMLSEKNEENAKLRDFIELLLSCPRDSGECKECRRLNDMCVVELEAGELGIEVE